jgi:4-amino-4-deoxy-L-arabinose transferase-like glycosyltransferase
MLSAPRTSVKEKGRTEPLRGRWRQRAGRMRLVARASRASQAAWLLLAGVFLLKSIALSQLHDHPLLHADAGLDTTAYANLARRVVGGDILLGPGLYYVSPLYIYVLAAGLWLFDSFTAVRMLQIGLGTLSVACIFMMARAWFGSRAAWIAAALATGTGLLTFYELLILQSSLDGVFAAAALTALTCGLRGSRRPNAAMLCAGLLFGASILNRPNMLFGALAVIAAALIVRRWRAAVLLSLGLATGVAPGLVRNLAVTGEPSIISSHGGLNLYIGNHANATGFYRAVPGIRPLIEGQQDDARRVASAAASRPLTESEASSYFRDQAVGWILDNPVAASTLFARKLFFTFHAQHVPLPHSYPFYAYDAGSILRALPIGPWLLVPLGLTGLLFRDKTMSSGAGDRRDFIIWAAFVPGYAVGIAVFFVAERYRLALLIPLCGAAGGAIDFLLRRWRAGAARALIGPTLVAGVIAIAVNWPMPWLTDGRWEEGLRTAQRLVILGDLSGADDWAARLERTTTAAGRAHHGVGMQLVAQGNEGAALPHLRRSIELGFPAAEDPELWLRLGRLAARTEGPAAAAPFFRRAAATAPGSAAARQQHGLNLLVLERYDEAMRELAEAVRLDPQDPDSLAHLAYAEIRLGKAEAARAHLRAAQAQDPEHALSRQLAAAFRGGI